MNRQKFSINDLRVAAPCPASWNAMTGDERKRFCALCELNVYNISEMTPAEVQKMLDGASDRSGGRFCGRIYRRADGTVLTKDCPTGLRALRKRTVRLAGATLSAILGLFSLSYAQNTPPDKPADGTTVAVPLRNEIKPLADGRRILTGTLRNIDETVLANTEVFIYPANSNKYEFKNVIRTRTDSGGRYVFDGIPAGAYVIEAEGPNGTYAIVSDVQIADGEKVIRDVKVNYAPITGLVNIIPPPPKTEPGKTIITREMLDRMPKRNLFDY